MQAGELTSEALVKACLQRIASLDQNGPALNAVQHLNPLAVQQAITLDQERAANQVRSMLHGIPVLIKDNYETLEMPTTAGSKLFAGFHPQRDATLVMRLRQAGAILLAKTTMHEFAYGITTVGSAFGATRNPYDPSRNPGGSSGGTGAAIAAGYAPAGYGSDTCGSVRIPAAQNNLFGIRATQGFASRAGIVPLSSTQDIGGPLARTVQDLALLLGITGGYDPADPQTRVMQGRNAEPEPWTKPEPIRIGVLSDWMVQDPLDQPVAAVVDEALQAMAKKAGWQIESCPSPALNKALDRPWNGHVVLIHDFKRDIQAYLAANPELGLAGVEDILAEGQHHPDIQSSLEASAFMPDAETQYARELAQRPVVAAALDALLLEGRFDALAYPTIRRIAAPLGEEQLGTNCRLAANSGYPAISIPAGFTAEGMPVGLELLAQPFSESKLLAMAAEVEAHHPARRPPPLSEG